MGVTVEEFRNHILDSGYVLDPEGVHHEFVSGMHGRKLDFDKIPDDSQLFAEWVEVAAGAIYMRYIGRDLGKLTLVSVANGTNRLVGPVAATIGRGVSAVLTEKATPKSVKLTDEAKERIAEQQPSLALIVEDVGTSGETTSTAVVDVRSTSVPEVEALSTWQRRERLEKLEAVGAKYSAIIKEVLPTYPPLECEAEGYCAQGWEFIPRQ